MLYVILIFFCSHLYYSSSTFFMFYIIIFNLLPLVETFCLYIFNLFYILVSFHILFYTLIHNGYILHFNNFILVSILSPYLYSTYLTSLSYVPILLSFILTYPTSYYHTYLLSYAYFWSFWTCGEIIPLFLYKFIDK